MLVSNSCTFWEIQRHVEKSESFSSLVLWLSFSQLSTYANICNQCLGLFHRGPCSVRLVFLFYLKIPNHFTLAGGICQKKRGREFFPEETGGKEAQGHRRRPGFEQEK